MNMMPSNIEMKIVSPAYIGAMVNSAIYLASVFTAGLVMQNHWAWRAAIVAMGVTYLSYLAQMPRLHPRADLAFDPTPAYTMLPIVVRQGIVVVSIVLGTFAGLMLLY